MLKEFWADPLKTGRPSFPVILGCNGEGITVAGK
jgi:hypothetical protein